MAWPANAVTHRPTRPLILLSLALPLLLSACGEKPDAPANIRPVRVATVTFAQDGAMRQLSGTIVPRTEVQAGFRTAGRIAVRLVEVGDRVRPGQVLARLDAADLTLSLRAAEARLAQAQAQAIQATADLKRYTPLLASGTIAQAQFDRVKAAADAATAQQREAVSGLDLARRAASYADLTLDEGGIVTAVQADAGQVVAAGQSVLRIATARGLEVSVDVAEGEVARLSPGQTANVGLWADKDLTLSGTIREITPAADGASRTFRLRIALPADTPSQVRLGMTARVGLSNDLGATALLPASSLFQQGDKPAVWVMNPAKDRVILRPVTVVAYRADGVLIRDGIKEGDLVVTAGASLLDAGQPVRVWDGGMP